MTSPAPEPSRRVWILCQIFLACLAVSNSLQAREPQLIDHQATPETRALFHNLHETAREHVLFGHQNTLAYGYDWANADNRSDVKAVTGTYPAVFGWDLMDLLSEDGDNAAYAISRERLLDWARQAYRLGGVSTFSWHARNPVTGGSFYDKTPAIHALIPGGSLHDDYRASLDKIAAFFQELAPVPVIFRPFHEHNGDWFWWGKPFTSEDAFIELWRFTVKYLRDEKLVHNVIYAFSPDRSRLDLDKAREEYFYAYPGDNYVDILGLDNYWDVGHTGNSASAEEKAHQFVRSLELVVQLADERGKLPALTETGLDTLSRQDWYTNVLLKGLAANEHTRRIAYLQVWRNANRSVEGRDHFYVPYPGHPAAADFIRFKESDLILFADELPDLYALPGQPDN